MVMTTIHRCDVCSGVVNNFSEFTILSIEEIIMPKYKNESPNKELIAKFNTCKECFLKILELMHSLQNTKDTGVYIPPRTLGGLNKRLNGKE